MSGVGWWVCVLFALAASAGSYRLLMPWLFAPAEFDVHVSQALAVVEPSDDFQLWSQEIRGAWHDVYGGDE